jgi:PTS system N-acetylglucosamine-specific IIC component
MQWISGFGFSAGLVDMLLSARNPLATHWYMLLVQGVVFFVIYYVVFRFTIIRFNLLTPGRELAVSGDESDGYNPDMQRTQPETSNMHELAVRYLQSIGGAGNLTGIDACITRLRLAVKDSAEVNDQLAKKLGASAVVRLNKQSVQIIVGTQAESIAAAMRSVIAEEKNRLR